MRIFSYDRSIRPQNGPAGKLSSGWIPVASCFLLAGAIHAQLPSSPQSPDLKRNPVTALQTYEEPSNEEYVLGSGDEISIDFAGRPELSCKRVVGPDGRISIAPAGSILVAEQTRAAAAAAISSAMSTYYSRPFVTVGVDRYTSNRVLVLGAVEHPGMVAFDRPPTLVESLSQAGGLLARRNLTGGTDQTTMRQASVTTLPERCAIYRGNNQVLWVDLQELLAQGSSLAALRLKRNDVVYVPAQREKFVSVLGQVQHPGALRLDEDTTLTKLLAEAGGLTTQAGKSPNLQVIQPSTGKTRVVPFKALLQPSSLDFTLKSGDVLYVPESGFNQASYIFQQISPLLSVFTAAVLFQH